MLGDMLYQEIKRVFLNGNNGPITVLRDRATGCLLVEVDPV